MPRLLSEDCVVLSVRIPKGDAERVRSLFHATGEGDYGAIASFIRRSIKLLLYFEEIRNGLRSAPEPVVAAIHIVQTTLHRRVSGEDDQVQVAEISAAPEGEAHNAHREPTKERRKRTRRGKTGTQAA